jgi:hypothetical protein
LSKEKLAASRSQRTLAIALPVEFALRFIFGATPRAASSILAPFGTCSYPGKGLSVSALIRVKLEMANVVFGGFKVMIPFLAPTNRESLASNLKRYVPTREKLATVES